MTSTARIEKEGKNWVVIADYGPFRIIYGPYWWKWLADLVAWSENRQH